MFILEADLVMIKIKEGGGKQKLRRSGGKVGGENISERRERRRWGHVPKQNECISTDTKMNEN